MSPSFIAYYYCYFYLSLGGWVLLHPSLLLWPKS
jgi:hypothetical protein